MNKKFGYLTKEDIYNCFQAGLKELPPIEDISIKYGLIIELKGKTSDFKGSLLIEIENDTIEFASFKVDTNQFNQYAAVLTLMFLFQQRQLLMDLYSRETKS